MVIFYHKNEFLSTVFYQKFQKKSTGTNRRIIGTVKYISVIFFVIA